jgi:hypothetical protein
MRTSGSLDATRLVGPFVGFASFLIRLAAIAPPLICAGCTFGTLDLRRPLVVETVTADDLRPFACEDSDSFRWTSSALESFRVQGYNDVMVYHNIERDTKALHSCTDNPFAWVQLGSDLALTQQPGLATKATEEGLRRLPSSKELDSLRAADPAWKRSRELQVVALLNVASYNVALEDYAAAQDALAAVRNPPSLDPFGRLAYYWLEAETQTGLGYLEAADESLRLARKISQDELDRSQVGLLRIEYPQYFVADLRNANHQYISGQVRSAGRDFAAAEAAFESAISRAPQLWEAHFALANVLLEMDQKERALIELESLNGKMPTTMFWRTERISFNLGNALVAQKKWQQAARSFQNAIDIVKARNVVYRRKIARLLRDRRVTGVTRELLSAGLSEDEENFPEAYNNLGNCFLELWLQSRWAGPLLRAEKAFKTALSSKRYSSRYVAHANLARVYWDRKNVDLFLREITVALMIRPTYRDALWDLYGNAVVMSAAQKIEAYNRLLDALSENGPREFVAQEFGDWLGVVGTFLKESARVPMALRAEAKLLHLQSKAVAEMELYAAADGADNLVWRSVGTAELKWESGRGDRHEIEGLLSRAIEGIENGSQQGNWSAFDARSAYLLRARIRQTLGKADLADADFAKASTFGPEAVAGPLAAR